MNECTATFARYVRSWQLTMDVFRVLLQLPHRLAPEPAPRALPHYQRVAQRLVPTYDAQVILAEVVGNLGAAMVVLQVLLEAVKLFLESRPT